MDSMRTSAHADLRAGEERLRLALESAQVGSWDLDLTSGRSPVRSIHHDQIFGYDEPVEDWTYDIFMEHVHPEDRAEVDRTFHEALSSGGTWNLECRIFTKNGDLRWIWARGGAYRNGGGKPVRALGIVSDITERMQGDEERKQLHAQLQVERSRLREIFMRAPALIATLRGPDHIYETANPLYLETVGNRDIIGKTVAEALPEVVDQGIIELLDGVYQTSEPFVANEMGVLIDRRGDGELEEVFFNFVYQPLFDSDGLVSGIFVHAVDITPQVTSRREAEEANRAKAAFLATMSHELRTPLNAIIGYSDLLDAEIAGPLNEAQKVQLGRIDIGARHLLQIIEEILTFSRIEAGREEVQAQTVDIAELARESCRLLEPLAAIKALELTCHTPERLLIETDPGKVRQILLNLLSNAVKFTETGHVILEVLHEGDDVLLRTIDTGVGVPPEQQQRIFEPFSQIGQALSRQKGGTGLGLSVTQQLARLLGGEIEVESTPGEGSIFTVRLPATRA